MKWFLFFLLLAISFASLGLWYIIDPGYIEITWLGYNFNSTLILVFVYFIIFSFFLIMFLRFFIWIVEIPRRWKSFHLHSQDIKANQELINLLISYEAEMFNDALDHHKRATPKLSKNPLFLWISGNVFSKTGKFLEAGQCFMELTKNPLTSFLGYKGAIRAALHHSDFKGAYHLLERSEKLMPTSTWVLKHLAALTRERKEYKKSEELINRLENLGRFTAEQSKRQISHLQYQQALDSETSAGDREILLRQAHFLDPSHWETTEALANLLYENGGITPALRVIETTWNLTPVQVLGDLYIKISEPQNELETYKIATKLVQKSKNHSMSLLLLSRTALKARLWGEARCHLTKLLKQDQSVKIYLLLARLELEEHQDINAALKYLSVPHDQHFCNRSTDFSGARESLG